MLQLNINPGYNTEIVENCHTLFEYIQYTERVRRYKEEQPLAEAVERAVNECIEDGILADFLRKNRSEVIPMSIFEYDEELHRRTLKEEGQWEKLQKIVYHMLQKDQTPETISELTGEPLEHVYKLQEEYVEMVRETEKYRVDS